MNRKILAVLAGLLWAPYLYAATIFEAPYGVQNEFPFEIWSTDGLSVDVDESDAGTDAIVLCNAGTEATSTNDYTDEGSSYSIVLTAAEMQCETITVVINEAVDTVFYIQTYGDITNARNQAIPLTDFGTNGGLALLDANLNVQADVEAIDDDASSASGTVTFPNATLASTTNITAGTMTTTATATNVTTVSTGAISEASFATTAGSFDPLFIIDQGTAVGATATTLDLRAAVGFADDELNGAEILITGGSAGVGQTRLITDYTLANDRATVATWTTTPSGTITYQVRSATATGGSVSIGVGGIAANSFAAGAIDSTAIATDAIGAAEVADNTLDAGAFATNALTDVKFNSAAGSFYALGVIDQGTAQLATSTTLQLRAAVAFANDEINGATCLITGGSTGVSQSRLVTDYDSASDTATVDAWTTTPTGTITYRCYGTAPGGAGTTLTQADVRTAVGLGAANLDTQLANIESGVDVDTIEAGDATTAIQTAAAAALDAENGANFTAIDLPNQTMDITGTLTTVTNVTTVNGFANDALVATDIAADVTTELQAGLATAAAVDAVDNFVDGEITALLNARTQIFPGNVDADSVLTANSGDANTLVDAELTFASANDIDGVYVVRDDGQRCFVDSFNPGTDTIEFGACAFTGVWATQTYKLYPANTQ